ncbi:elongator complex protein 3 [Haliovirga abyssi]|uniref:Coproporphyrinogen III oxidase n=1 Tax=Haliovirga abyssi TaxID=2996794 RepID=A0AAU9DVX8_9FUSO|nr:radical SAM protein [Haliovirga abyssi]BDU50386.1 coproporphyrinogen III oxidase [Haliovirga abyssi]
MKHYNIPIFIVHYGCPHMCVFCNQQNITGVITNIQPNEIRAIIEETLKTLPKNSEKEIAFFGGTFTGLPIKLQTEFLEVANEYIKKGLVNGIRMSTRPDYINREILDNLSKYNVTTIELGVQSFNTEVLKLSERGHSREDVFNASELIKEYGITLGLQIMPGLPGSTIESDIAGIEDILKIMPSLIRIYPTLVLENTKLNSMYKNEEYQPLSISDAVKITLPMIIKLELNGIKIIRVGLQPADDLRKEGVITAGPFHSSFREVVESEIYYEFLNIILKKEKELNVITNQSNISRIVGMNKVNLKKFNGKLNFNIDNSLEKELILVNKKSYKRKNILMALEMNNI